MSGRLLPKTDPTHDLQMSMFLRGRSTQKSSSSPIAVKVVLKKAHNTKTEEEIYEKNREQPNRGKKSYWGVKLGMKNRHKPKGLCTEVTKKT